MKIVKFDRSFSSRTITDEVFFFSFSLDTKKHPDPYCVSSRVTFHFSGRSIAPDGSSIYFITRILVHQPSARRRGIRYRGTTVLVRRSFATSASLPIREKRREGRKRARIYNYSSVFSLSIFFLAPDKWYSYVLRKPRLRVVKSPWIWFYASWIEWKNKRCNGCNEVKLLVSLPIAACPSPWNRHGSGEDDFSLKVFISRRFRNSPDIFTNLRFAWNTILLAILLAGRISRFSKFELNRWVFNR